MQSFETEEQQVEAIRKWFKDNGNSLLWTVVITASLVFGFRYWQHHQEVVKIEASEVYMAMMQAVGQEDLTTADSKAVTLVEDYANSPYADLASLYQAKAAVGAKDLTLAATYLKKVMDSSKIEDFQYIARARLARVMLADNKAEEALALFEGVEDNSYTTLLQELKGDILLVLNRRDEAKQAYQLAYNSIDDVERPLLKLKLQELGGMENDRTSMLTQSAQYAVEAS